MEQVILVDFEDNAIGTMEKLEAHRLGVLHRAFSILVFNSAGELLLQKRAQQKYHSGGLWTNTCCSHPQPHETMEEATQRKLMQEMGIHVPLTFSHKFVYKAALNDGLTEHEYDHVYTGVFDGEPAINQDEVEGWKYVDLAALREDIQTAPHAYTSWFKLIMAAPQGLPFTPIPLP